MEPNFIIIPTSDPFDLLWDAFPELKGRIDRDEEELGAYYVYNRLAEYISAYRKDDELWERLQAFLEKLAEPHPDLMIELLESVCCDAGLTERTKSTARPKTRKLWDSMR